MDVLHPHLINIEGRIYCKYNVDSTSQLPDELIASNEGNPADASWWDDEPNCQEQQQDDVVQNSNGMYETSLPIPSALFKYIIGSRGDTKKRLEYETKTRVNIPSKGCEGDVVITGKDISSVVSAKTRINLLVASKRWKQPFTHFISIPLTSDDVKEGFGNFKTTVLENFANEQGVDKSIFQNPLKLHLTICTLVLLNSSEIEQAKEVLRRCDDDIMASLKEPPIEINVQGLEYMNDDPGAVDVLYAKVNCVDGSDRLQVLADRLLETFTSAGLSEKQYDRVKLHGTLMNTTFRRRDEESSFNSRRKQRESFNAAAILANLSDFNFGRMTVNEIHLSEKRSTDQSGYYSVTDKLNIV